MNTASQLDPRKEYLRIVALFNTAQYEECISEARQLLNRLLSSYYRMKCLILIGCASSDWYQGEGCRRMVEREWHMVNQVAHEDEEESQRALAELRSDLDELAGFLAEDTPEEVDDNEVRQEFNLLGGTDDMFNEISNMLVEWDAEMLEEPDMELLDAPSDVDLHEEGDEMLLDPRNEPFETPDTAELPDTFEHPDTFDSADTFEQPDSFEFSGPFESPTIKEGAATPVPPPSEPPRFVSALKLHSPDHTERTASFGSLPVRLPLLSTFPPRSSSKTAPPLTSDKPSEERPGTASSATTFADTEESEESQQPAIRAITPALDTVIAETPITPQSQSRVPNYMADTSRSSLRRMGSLLSLKGRAKSSTKSPTKGPAKEDQ